MTSMKRLERSTAIERLERLEGAASLFDQVIQMLSRLSPDVKRTTITPTVVFPNTSHEHVFSPLPPNTIHARVLLPTTLTATDATCVNFVFALNWADRVRSADVLG